MRTDLKVLQDLFLLQDRDKEKWFAFSCYVRKNADDTIDLDDAILEKLDKGRRRGVVEGKLMIAGQPYDSDTYFAAAGEDFCNNRLCVTLVDWAKAVNGGWRTKLDLDDLAIEEVMRAMAKYLEDGRQAKLQKGPIEIDTKKVWRDRNKTCDVEFSQELRRKAKEL